jgi:heme A synthase
MENLLDQQLDAIDNHVTRRNRFALYAWGVVVYTLLVILWGAYVRASGSGAGCGNHWPLCNGQVLPHSKQIETLIELTHRLMSGLSLLLIIGLAVWAFRAYTRKHPIRFAATLSLVFILTEALIGAVLVRAELVAGNASLSRAIVMSIHLVNTFTLMAFLTLTAWWASGRPAIRLRGQGFLLWLFALALIGTLILAVSGAVAALGDTLFPAESLAAGFDQDVSPTAHFLIRLRLLHPVLALIVGSIVLIVASVANVQRPGKWVRQSMLTVTALVVVQLLVGLVNVALLAPIWLQLVHLLLADLLWMALVVLMASALEEKVSTTSQY